MNLEFKMNDRISPATMVHSPFVHALLNFRRERPGRDIAEPFSILYDFDPNAEISTPRRQCAQIRTSSGSMVNAAPLYVPIYGDFEAPGTRSSRAEDASVDTNLQDAELVQALGGFVASGEVVFSSGWCSSSLLTPAKK